MGVINSGAPGVPTQMALDPTNAAMRATIRPNELSGSYRASVNSGTITFSNVSSAGGILYTFKYTGGGVCMVRSVQIGMLITATGLTTSGYCPFSLYAERGTFTQGTTNGTGYGTGQATSLINKKRTSLSPPNASIVIYNGTSTGITGDSVTEDSVRLATVNLGAAVSTVTTLPADGMRDMLHMHNLTPYQMSTSDWQTYPLILAANEGFRIKNDAAFINGTTGSGTAVLTVSVEWEEATTY